MKTMIHLTTCAIAVALGQAGAMTARAEGPVLSSHFNAETGVLTLRLPAAPGA